MASTLIDKVPSNLGGEPADPDLLIWVRVKIKPPGDRRF